MEDIILNFIRKKVALIVCFLLVFTSSISVAFSATDSSYSLVAANASSKSKDHVRRGANKYLNLGNPGLEAAIARELNVEKVLVSSLKEVYYVPLEANEVFSLKGLEKLPSLTSIYINEYVFNKETHTEQTNVKWDFKELSKYKNVSCISYATTDEARLKAFLMAVKPLKHVDTLCISYLGPYLKNVDMFKGSKVTDLNIFYTFESESDLKEGLDLLKKIKNVSSVNISYMGPYLKNVDMFKGIMANTLDISACIEDYSGLDKISKGTKVIWEPRNSPEGLDNNRKVLKREKQEEEASRLADEIIQKFDLNNMTTDQKIKFVHDYIVDTVSYNYENYKNDTIPDESYRAYGALANNIAVCSGYAYAFKLFMDKLGVECYYVTGDAYSYGSWGGHAWNIVKTDMGYRMIDVTWDDPVTEGGLGSNRIRYDYYLLTDAQLAQLNDHRLDENHNFPKCE